MEFTIVGEAEIAKLSLAPGDILVVKINHTLDSSIAGRVRDHFERVLDRKNRALILDNSIDLSVLTRAEIDAQSEIKAM